jgi:hypothetical protein
MVKQLGRRKNDWTDTVFTVEVGEILGRDWRTVGTSRHGGDSSDSRRNGQRGIVRLNRSWL